MTESIKHSKLYGKWNQNLLILVQKMLKSMKNFFTVHTLPCTWASGGKLVVRQAGVLQAMWLGVSSSCVWGSCLLSCKEGGVVGYRLFASAI